jgi:cephalosporin hydroxylase
MAFPDYQTWLDTVVHPRERIATRNSPWCFEHPDWHAHYKRKHDIAWALNPKRILEIGVRYGYSAHAFLSACPDAKYQGIDSDDPRHNAMGEPTLAWAETMLRQSLLNGSDYGYGIVMTKMDTQKCPFQHRGDPFDLVHIDADHSYSGCLSDLRRTWSMCARAVVVDDYGSIASVQDAVAAFLKETPATLLKTDGFLGDAIIMKGAP